MAFNISLSIRKNRQEHKLRLNAKLRKLSIRQDRPIKKETLIPSEYLTALAYQFLNRILCPTAQNFQTAIVSMDLFFEDIGKQIRTLLESRTDFEKLCENEASAKCYAINVRETIAGRGVVNVTNFLNDNDIVTVHFDKATEFRLIKRQSHQKRLAEIFD